MLQIQFSKMAKSDLASMWLKALPVLLKTLPFSVNVVSCRKLEDVLTRLSGSKLYGYIDREVHRGAKRPGNKGGQVVSVLAFCSDDPSLNLAVNFFGNNDNKRKCCEYLRVAYNPSF